jgi:kumamolisin
MSNEPRTTLPGSEKHVPVRAERIGTPDPGEQVEVTLRLRPKNPLPEPGSATPVMTPEAYLEKYGAARDDLEAVADFAHEHHLSVAESSAERRTVILRGQLSDVEQAFGAQLHLYQARASAGGPEGAAARPQFRGRSGTLSLPTDMIGIIEGVFGLDDRPQAHTQFRYAAPPDPQTAAPGVAHPMAFTAGFPVSALTKAYAFPAAFDGSGQTVAIIELGGGYRTADLKAYFKAAGVRAPKVSSVSVDGARNQPTGDPNGADGEVMLDIEVVGASAPGVRIVVYFAPNTDAGFLNAVTRAAHDPVHRPSVISISWGAAESAWTVQAMTNMTQAFQEAGLLGVSVFCAAGDDGSSDRVTGGGAHADFPASSPAATGCGGTRLVLQGGQIASEVVWNNGPGRGATGGGVSDVYPLPAYQSAAGVPASVNTPPRVGRGVPDICAVADPQTGYQVRVDGVDTVIGGTSAVSPLWAGLTARLNQALSVQNPGTRLGFLNPQLYALNAAAFRDITSGDNGGYQAGPGWDACTGLGSPNGEALLAALKARPRG